ncbi:MAG TPA: ABC transporter ATP-binding protein [Mycobacteriales bacterium]|nr:ABC transporter ATP-binding protein [Mycobacteriales bacterium]
MTLDVTDLSVTVGGRRVVEGLGFSVGAGERLGLIGESGSGKSMTALAIMGLLPEGATAAGSVRVGGSDILGRPERALARIRGVQLSMVFQEPMTALDPVMRIGAQVALALRLHQKLSRRSALERARELLATVELPDPDRMLRAYPHQLSGGQRQRVVLAMALAHDPEVLICDEPTTALDVTVQARMLALIDRLVVERNAALLFITHDLAVVSGLCQRVLVVHEGRPVESGPVAEVFTAPQTGYTADLLAASDLAAAEPGTRLKVGRHE